MGLEGDIFECIIFPLSSNFIVIARDKFLFPYQLKDRDSVAVYDCKHLLLTEFEVCTVSYRPCFFPLIDGPSAKRAGHKSMGKNEDL